jgi:hypothetical protein
MLEAVQEIDLVAGKLVKTGRTGVLKSLVDQATVLGAHEGTISQVGPADLHLPFNVKHFYIAHMSSSGR